LNVRWFFPNQFPHKLPLNIGLSIFMFSFGVLSGFLSAIFLFFFSLRFLLCAKSLFKLLTILFHVSLVCLINNLFSAFISIYRLSFFNCYWKFRTGIMLLQVVIFLVWFLKLLTKMGLIVLYRLNLDFILLIFFEF